MAKRRTVLTFHLWLNLAMEDVYLGRLSLFVSWGYSEKNWVGVYGPLRPNL